MRSLESGKVESFRDCTDFGNPISHFETGIIIYKMKNGRRN